MMHEVTEQNGVWQVPLSKQHAPYTATALRRNYPTLDGYTVIIVNTQKFMRAFANDAGFVIPPASQWPVDQLTHARAKLAPREAGQPALEMPFAHIKLARQRRWFGLLPPRLVPVVSFTNGRHRARYLEFAGAAAFPVEVERRDAALMQEWCGT